MNKWNKSPWWMFIGSTSHLLDHPRVSFCPPLPQLVSVLNRITKLNATNLQEEVMMQMC